jgi:hypothetical protein
MDGFLSTETCSRARAGPTRKKEEVVASVLIVR